MARPTHRQPYGSEELYQAKAVKLGARYAQSRHWPAEVQCLQIGPDTVLVGMPGEYFSDDGLRIKMARWLAHTFVVSQANDKLGYIPSRKAFDGGGYETTFSSWSKLHENAADILAEAALDLLGRRP